MDNKVAKKPQVSIQTYMRSGAVQERLQETFKDRAQQFTISIISAVNANVLLQECPPQSIITAAMKAAAMDLPIDPNLGLAYIIPYRNNKLKIYEAQFQMGWRGYVQLAQRSRQYKLINATDVYADEYKGENRMTGEIEFEWIDDEKERKKSSLVGYLGFFRLGSGFEKMLYMTVDELKDHAKHYSQSYRKGYGLWVDDFPAMAKKTVIKLLIARWGPMSTQMQQAILSDQAVVEEDSFKYIDNDKTPEASQAPQKPHKATKTAKVIPEAETVPEASEEAKEEETSTDDEGITESAANAADARRAETKKSLLDNSEEPSDEDELEAIRLSIMLAGDLMDLTKDDLKKIYLEVAGKDDLDTIVDPMELETIYDYLEELEKQMEGKEETETPKQRSAFDNVKGMFPDAEDITPKQ
jgi:recombination protein RecT